MSKGFNRLTRSPLGDLRLSKCVSCVPYGKYHQKIVPLILIFGTICRAALVAIF